MNRSICNWFHWIVKTAVAGVNVWPLVLLVLILVGCFLLHVLLKIIYIRVINLLISRFSNEIAISVCLSVSTLLSFFRFNTLVSYISFHFVSFHFHLAWSVHHFFCFMFSFLFVSPFFFRTTCDWMTQLAFGYSLCIPVEFIFNEDLHAIATTTIIKIVVRFSLSPFAAASFACLSFVQRAC